jgi:hypothetical protein
MAEISQFQRNLLPPSGQKKTIMKAADACDMMVHSIGLQHIASRMTVFFVNTAVKTSCLG